MRILGDIRGKTLIIAPLRVAAHTWPDEIKKWSHTQDMSHSLVVGSAKARKAALKAEADTYIINRENIPWLCSLYPGSKWPFETVVIDELSSFKSNQAARFKALRKARPYIKRIIGLTGTPSPNGLIDLWAQMYLIDQGERLGKFIGGYRSRYFYPVQQSGHIVYKWGVRDEAEAAIYAQVSDITMSMRAKDVLQLPGRIDNKVEVQLTEVQAKAYRQMEREQVLELADTDVTAQTAATVANKLLQMANGAVYNDGGSVSELHTAKLDALAEIVEGAQGSPILCYYAYRHDLARIKQKFPEAVTIDEEGAFERWNKGEIPLLLAHPQSAGHGLNLQSGGHTVVWFGLTWSLEAYQQANARLDRQGQTETVVVHHLIAKGTIDERVMEVLQGKGTLQDALLDAMRANGVGLKRKNNQEEEA